MKKLIILPKSCCFLFLFFSNQAFCEEVLQEKVIQEKSLESVKPSILKNDSGSLLASTRQMSDGETILSDSIAPENKNQADEAIESGASDVEKGKKVDKKKDEKTNFEVELKTNKKVKKEADFLIKKDVSTQVIKDSNQVLTAPDQVNKGFFNNPSFRNRLVADLGIYDNFKSNNRSDKFLDSQFGSRLFTSINLSKNLSFYSLTRLTRLDNSQTLALRNLSREAPRNRNFENLGVYLPEVNLRFSHKRNLLLLGKFTPDFGNGWRWDRGIFIQSLPSQYKQSEKLGIADSFQLGDAKKNGLYELAVSFFRNDETFLYNSLFAKRDGIRSQAGRAGSTNGLNSFVVSANVSFDFSEDEKLSYHFSHLNLAVDKNSSLVSSSKINNQKGLAAGVSYKYPVGNYLKLYSMLEYVEMNNVNGNSDIADNYFTASLGTKWFNRWTTMIGNSFHRNENAFASGFNESLSELSFGYDCPKTAFFDRFTAQIGYQIIRTNHKTRIDERNSVGLLLRYYRNF